MKHIARFCRQAVFLTLVGVAVALPATANAGAIAFDTFLEFGFETAGLVSGCNPADAAGPFCVDSFGTPTTFLDAPPWTFNAIGAGASLTVTDAFLAGDQFEVFDFGISLGLTSTPIGVGDCGDDPVPCLADPNISKGVFFLAPGNHMISIAVLADGLGSGYLNVSTIVPEPQGIALFGLGVIAAAGSAFRRRGISRRKAGLHGMEEPR